VNLQNSVKQKNACMCSVEDTFENASLNQPPWIEHGMAVSCWESFLGANMYYLDQETLSRQGPSNLNEKSIFILFSSFGDT
jgi:hypothetical protein